MTEGDPINFSWYIEAAASWAGSVFTGSVRGDDGQLVSLSVAVTAVAADALFVMTALPQGTLPASRSGYVWALRETGGPTRFNGLLFVDPVL